MSVKVTAAQVKELRDRTGVGMLDARNALVDNNGDMDAAIDYLRTQGLAAAAKKSDRIAAEGLAATYVDGNTAALVEVNSETDFVARNEQFQNLVKLIVKAVAENKPADMEAALALVVDGESIQDRITEATNVIGERLDFRRFAVLVKEDSDVFGAYTHAGGNIVSVVRLSGTDNEEVARDIAMHVAAINPKYTTREDIPAEEVEREESVQRERALAEGRPEHIVDKMITGRMNRFYSEQSLVEQDFIKDNDLTVGKYAENAGGEVTEFARFEVGEGLERREEDFASEVAAQMKKD